MTNLPKNPRPRYGNKDDKSLFEKSSKISEDKVMDELTKIIKENKKLEEKYSHENT